MNDTTGSFHPLSRSGTQIASIAHIVLMLYMAIDHIGECVESPMWMRWETRNIVTRIVTAKMIQQNEWIIIT